MAYTQIRPQNVAWIGGRFGVAATAMVGAFFYLRESFAYAPLLGLTSLAMTYDAGLATILSRKRLLLAFLLGFSLDNLVTPDRLVGSSGSVSGNYPCK